MFQKYLRISLVKLMRMSASETLKHLVSALAFISILIVFLPLNPGMPNVGLDPSWQFSMNAALAQNLKIGQEIIFTFGPYSSIFTQFYHPATDHLILLSSLFLGLCYAISLLYLAKNRSPYFLFAFVIFISGFMYARDPLLFSYPLMLAAGVAKFFIDSKSDKKTELTVWQTLAVVFVFVPLGLLPLIKSSLLLICGATVLMISSCFLYYRYRTLAFLSLITPTVSVFLFWKISRQDISSLPGYFISMSEIISGYTEAMALQGENIEILLYLLATMVVIWVFAKTDKVTMPIKLFMIICFGLFFFISFKGGFVRHDRHALAAGMSIVFSVLTIIMIFTDKRRMIALLIPIIISAYIESRYVNEPIQQAFGNIYNTYINAWSGLHGRMTRGDELQNKFVESLDEIKEKYAIPPLQGTTDIYSYDQAYLLASNNQWNPRPIIQSYSVYTSVLAQINEQHLRGNSSPDNVLFSVQPIDGRLPSLEDGLSWPALSDNYTVTRLDNDMAYLRKKKIIKSDSTFDLIYEGVHKIEDEVVLPVMSTPVYATINLELTSLGKLLSLVFKPPQLKISLNLTNGINKEYRVLSNMMVSGFFVSPLINDTKDFVFLVTGNQRYLENNKVESFVIIPSYGASVFWSSTYSLELKSFRGEIESSFPEDLFDNMMNAIPHNYVEAEISTCDGAVDEINGASLMSLKTEISGLLSSRGWLAVSTKEGIAPDDIFLTLEDSNGIVKYIKTHKVQRNDVNAFFKKPTMPDVGYEAFADVSGLNGDYTVGLAKAYKGKFERCSQFNIPVRIGVVK